VLLILGTTPARGQELARGVTLCKATIVEVVILAQTAILEPSSSIEIVILAQARIQLLILSSNS